MSSQSIYFTFNLEKLIGLIAKLVLKTRTVTGVLSRRDETVIAGMVFANKLLVERLFNYIQLLPDYLEISVSLMHIQH